MLATDKSRFTLFAPIGIGLVFIKIACSFAPVVVTGFPYHWVASQSEIMERSIGEGKSTIAEDHKICSASVLSDSELQEHRLYKIIGLGEH